MTSPPARLNPTQIRIRVLMIALIVVIAAFVRLYDAYAAGDGPVLCPSRAVTTVPCPGCGMTRSFCAFAQGDLEASVSYHLFGPLVFVAMLSLVPLFAVEVWRRRRVALFDRLLFSTRVAYLFGGLWLTYHLGRLLSLWSSVNPGS